MKDLKAHQQVSAEIKGEIEINNNIKQLKQQIQSKQGEITTTKYKLIDMQQELDELETNLTQICTHETATVYSYTDYDRNKYTVICNICNKELIDYVNVFNYREFVENYRGILTKSTE